MSISGEGPIQPDINVPRAFNPSRFSPVPPGMGELNYIQTLLAGILDQTLYTTSTVKFYNMTLSGLTASMPVSTNSAKLLETLSVAGFRTLLGLGTADSPTLAGLTLGALSGVLKAASGVVAAATIGTSLDYTAPTLNAIQGIRTVDSPQFANLTLLAAASLIGTISVGATARAAQWYFKRGTGKETWFGPTAGDQLHIWTNENIPLYLGLNNAEVLNITSAGLINPKATTSIGLINPAQTFHLRLICGSALLADRNLTFTPGDAARTITLSGNPTLADWFDQAVKAASSPTLAGLTLTAFSGFVKATTGILSAAAIVDSDIPDDITLTNITQITNRSHTSLSDIGTLTHATLDTYLDQAVKVASSPTFAALKITTGAGLAKVLTSAADGTATWETAGSGMVYPGTGIPISTGSAWGTSLALAEQRLLGRITGEITGALTAAQAWGILAYGNTGLSIPYFSAVNTIAFTNPTLAYQLLRVNAGGTGYEWDTIGNIMSGTLDVTYDNLAILSWQLAIHAGLSLFKLEDGVTDEFEDETGVNTASSTYEVYNSTGDYYSPDSPDQIPTMTSNTAPSGTASADSEWTAEYVACKAMDDTNADSLCWLSKATFPHWLQYQFTSGKTITSYSITSRNSDPYYPTDWKIQGSNNGSSWTDLDTQTGQSFSQNQKKTYNFSNSTSYTYYRLYITAGVDANHVAVGEWELISPFDMTLISNSIEAELQPTKARFMALVEPVNAITLNTDIKGWISEDNAAHYDQVTLTDEGYFDATKKIYAGNVNLTDYTDKTMVQKITTHNNKNLKVHAWAMMWR